MRFGTFCGLGRFGVGTFCIWDVLELGCFVLGRFVLGRFVLGRFVGAPEKRTKIGASTPQFSKASGKFKSCFSVKRLKSCHFNVKVAGQLKIL